MPGYTVVQSFAMLLERTPTLRALDVRCGGVAQSIGFDPDVNAYTCSVTADSVELTAQPFSEAAALRINGTAVAAGESFRLAVPSSGARGRDHAFSLRENADLCGRFYVCRVLPGDHPACGRNADRRL